MLSGLNAGALLIPSCLASGMRKGQSPAWEEGTRGLQPPEASECPPVRCHRRPCGTAGCATPRGTGVQGSSGHTSEEEQPCLSHAGAARASTCLVTGKSQPRSALPSVKWILAAPPLKQSRRSGAMAGALSHGSPAPGSPCESARPGAPARHRHRSTPGVPAPMPRQRGRWSRSGIQAP